MTKHYTQRPPKEVWVIVDQTFALAETYLLRSRAEERFRESGGLSNHYTLRRYVLPPSNKPKAKRGAK